MSAINKKEVEPRKWMGEWTITVPAAIHGELLIEMQSLFEKPHPEISGHGVQLMFVL